MKANVAKYQRFYIRGLLHYILRCLDCKEDPSLFRPWSIHKHSVLSRAACDYFCIRDCIYILEMNRVLILNSCECKDYEYGNFIYQLYSSDFLYPTTCKKFDLF